MYAPRRFVDHSPYGYDGFEDVPNINEEKEASNIRSWEMNPGDVLLFHMRTLHAAGGRGHRDDQGDEYGLRLGIPQRRDAERPAGARYPRH